MSYKKFFVSTILASGVFTSMPAVAQDTDQGASEIRDSGVILVTARKREENLIDVPLPITVATQEQLERDQVYNLNDLQRITPALEISQTSGGETNGGGRLRGLGTGVFNPSVASSVALVVDQVPIGNLAFPQLFDLGQVEVLRGPQGTLFGQGASAGVLNISTVAPSVSDLSVAGSVNFADKGSAGSEVGELVVNGAVNVPFGEQAAVRLAGQYKKETGLQRSKTTGLDNEIKDFGLRARALLLPSDNLTVNISAEYAENESDGQTFFAIAIAPNATTPFGGPGGTIGGISTGAYTNPTGCGVTITERAEEYCEDAPTIMSLKIGGASVAFDLDLSDSLTLSSVSGYRERTFKQFSRDFSRLTGAPAARQERTQEDSRGFSQELRLNYVGDRVDLIVGGFYNDFYFGRIPMGTGPFTYGVNSPGNRIGFSVCLNNGFFCPVGTRFAKETTENRTLALFSDATVNLSEQFSLFGGLRYDDYKNTTIIQNFPAIPGNAGGPNSPELSFTTSDSNISGRAGVSFKPNPNTNLFASYSRGYKPPAVGTNPAGTLFQLLPEKTNAFEIGAKTRVGGLQLAANAFYTELENFQSQTSVFVGTALVSQPLNIPKIKSKGFEVTAFGKVFTGLNLNVGYQYNDIKFPTGYLGDDGVSIGGTQFLNAPRHKFTLSGDYAVPVSQGIELFLNANLIYKSKVLLAARGDPRYRYPSHEIINGGIGIRNPDGKWNASIFVRNLTKEREPTAYLASTFAGQTDGGIRAWPVAGLTARVVGVRVGFDF